MQIPSTAGSMPQHHRVHGRPSAQEAALQGNHLASTASTGSDPFPSLIAASPAGIAQPAGIAGTKPASGSLAALLALQEQATQSQTSGSVGTSGSAVQANQNQSGQAMDALQKILAGLNGDGGKPAAAPPVIPAAFSATA